jgi:hypothetical protein
MASAVNSGRTFRAEDLTIVGHFRFEGVSDPDDSSIVYAIESDDGTRGIIADAFPIYAKRRLADFLTHEPIREDAPLPDERTNPVASEP